MSKQKKDQNRIEEELVAELESINKSSNDDAIEYTEGFGDFMEATERKYGKNEEELYVPIGFVAIYDNSGKAVGLAKFTELKDYTSPPEESTSKISPLIYG